MWTTITCAPTSISRSCTAARGSRWARTAP
uniref:Uncharacterized protein n=1 Tax=Arundo donax TaxID=35708 RepID=A0A0A8ZV52_ARUDO